jgi:formylglycine-generating enzyme required for sulfatase activity
MDVRGFYVDKYPVTNAQFKQFLDASAYRPKDDHNFLKHWQGGTFPPNWDRKPVTWVSLDDARAYAAWAGKRLPHEWEWQYAAQGGDGRPYPWGKNPDPTALPKPEAGREVPPPTDVDAHPNGASPWGVMDLVGNVWQWSDEYVDEHTRAAVIRGGSYYRPGGSIWYFPPNTRLDQHAKYLLIAPSKDRSAMLGFRCVVDAADDLSK